MGVLTGTAARADFGQPGALILETIAAAGQAALLTLLRHAGALAPGCAA